MKVVFPIEEFCGADSGLYGHFGSAPLFAVLDTENGELSQINNGNREHEHGACHPMEALGNDTIDAIVVGGIGPSALMGLRRAGIRVFKSDAATIREAIEELKNGSLLEVAPGGTCGGHQDGGGCGCHHSH